MLLRRVTQHVKAQNWFAVFVDFLIVVVGVFMGLQVQDWNEARKERMEEQALLVRLHDETVDLIDTHDAELDQNRLRTQVLTSVNPVLFSQEPAREISEVECAYISGSHVYRRPSDELPVLDEMLSTGKFGILRDKAIKEQLRDYILLRERARAYYHEAINELFRLHSRFPDLIKVKRMATEYENERYWGGLAGEGHKWVPQCDAEKMRIDTAFLNEYIDNVSRLNSLIGYTRDRREHLELIESRITQLLE